MRRIKLLIFIVALTGSWNHLIAGASYTIKVDLKNVTNDKVKIVCEVPDIKEDNAVFVFASIAPGSYALKEYGRYIEGFKAYAADNSVLKVKKADKFNYRIYNATKLKRVEYYVNDTWEEKKPKQFIFQPSGTHIEAGKSYVVNNFAFFGYVEGYKKNAYSVTFTEPEGITGYSYMKKKSVAAGEEEFNAPDFDFLADNPILFCKPNQSFFEVGDCKVNVCVYSESGKIQAADIAENLEPVGEALEKFFGTLPVNEYYFLFYFDDPKNLPTKRGPGLSSGTGALEHNHSSFYYLLESDFDGDVQQLLRDVCSHEFLHILAPLHLHSKEIADFNFRTPVLSQHLWMYEGATEYFSDLAQLQDSLITLKEFMKKMRSNISYSKQFDEFSFTDMSKNVITPENQKRYLSVYNRGALLAMMLDWNIIQSTDGRMDLKKTMFALSKIYGEDRPFDDNELIGKFVELTAPQVQRFFDDYITGKLQPDYTEQFAKIGWDHQETYNQKLKYFGRFAVSYDSEKKLFVFFGVEPNLLNIEKGDILLSINGETVTTDNAEELVSSSFYENYEGNRVTVEVERKGQRLKYSALPVDASRMLKNYLSPMEKPNERQQFIFARWLEGR